MWVTTVPISCNNGETLCQSIVRTAGHEITSIRPGTESGAEAESCWCCH